MSPVVVITGGGRGIGAATAKHFAARGAKVAITARSVVELGAVRAGLGADSLAVAGDVSDEAFVKDFFAQVRAKLGPVDVLINNAATFVAGEIEKLAVADWDRSMAVNLRGPFLCSREAFAQMKGRGGLILNIASLGGLEAYEKFKGTAAYVVSKHGVVGLTQALAVEGREHGIRACCVAPGAVDTAMLRQAAPHLKTRTTPADVAEVLYGFYDPAGPRAKESGTVLPLETNL